MKIQFIHDIVESNGKTIKENNLEKIHIIPIGALVELKDYEGVRLYVVSHSRDCDGTPLYNLCYDKDDMDIEKKGFRNNKWVGGFSEESLETIKC